MVWPGSVLLLLPVLLFYFACILNDKAECIRWLALGSERFTVWNQSHHCPRHRPERKRYGLIGAQTKLCKRHADLMPVIMKAAAATVNVCQQQFRDHRWNCSSVRFVPNLTPDLTKGTREQALVYALSSAAVTHGIAKACSSGMIAYCPCGNVMDEFNDQEYVRKGCSDNILYGQKVSKEWTKQAKARSASAVAQQHQQQSRRRFNRNRRKHRPYVERSPFGQHWPEPDGPDDDNVDQPLTPRARMNIHNNRVGRNVIAQMLETKCKCHGVSGACTMKTCWKMLPPLDQIGSALKDRYRRATEVRWLDAGSSARYVVEPYAMYGRVTDDDLVFVKKSPDYCTEDRRVGSLGTRGRSCNATLQTSASCDSMCCGRGYESTTVLNVYNCYCRYVHCCYVECQQCREMVERHYCK